MSKRLDIVVEQGMDFSLPLFLKSGVADDGVDSSTLPIMDLRGYGAVMHIRPGVDSPLLHLELTTSNNLLRVDAETGCVWISIPGTLSKHWLWRSAVYALVMLIPGGGRMLLRNGSVRLEPVAVR